MNSIALSQQNQPSINLLDLLQEKRRRLVARRSMLAFTEYVDASYTAQWYHRLLCEHLEKFVRREIKNLMVFMPPQHGKSDLVSRKLPAFIFGVKPDSKVIAASYAAELIQGMNRDVQRILETPEYKRIFPETRLNEKNIRTVSGSYLRNNDIFEIVGKKGRYRCAGVGGGLTGFSCDFGIIDDPFKDYKEASSALVRNGVWEWYTSVFLSRTHNSTGKLLTQTRWHEDDLAGRLLEREPNEWTVLKLPAICDNPSARHETRREGAALWPERFSVEELRTREALNPHQFEALYQQNPTPREGAFFKVGNLEIVDAIPAGLKFVRGWDIGATAGAGDFSAGVKIGHDGKGTFYVVDVVRGQLATDDRNKIIRQTAVNDGIACRQLLPQDPGAAGKSMAESFTRLLAGYPVEVKPVSGDKETRADPFSSQVGAGNVKLLKALWNKDFIEELRQFPNGKHDDQCLIAGTMITTDTGQRAIETIKEGDFVLTRKGYRRVSWAGMTNPTAKVARMVAANGAELIGTGNHPVFAFKDGKWAFKPLDTCSDSVILVSCENTQKAARLTRLFTTGFHSIAIPNRSARRTEITTAPTRGISAPEWISCIAKYGEMLSGKFLTGMTFITRTAILSITTYPIWSALQSESIGASTRLKTEKKCSRTLKPCVTKQVLGTQAMRAGRGIAGTAPTHTLNERRRNLHVRLAGKILSLKILVHLARTARGFARKIALPACGDLRGGRNLKKLVCRAVSLFRDSRKLKLVPVNVVRVCDGTQLVAVYNLSVEGEHEYFANGILVHNCDSSSDAFNWLSRSTPRDNTDW